MKSTKPLLGVCVLALALTGCTTLSTDISTATGTTLAQRCVVYQDVAEPIAAAVAAGTDTLPEEQALVAAFNAINCPNPNSTPNSN
jgi:hypothetical protein